MYVYFRKKLAIPGHVLCLALVGEQLVDELEVGRPHHVHVCVVGNVVPEQTPERRKPVDLRGKNT